MIQIDRVHLEIGPHRGEFTFPEDYVIYEREQRNLSGTSYYPCFSPSINRARGLIKPKNGDIAEQIKDIYFSGMPKELEALFLGYVRFHNAFRKHREVYLEIDAVPRDPLQKIPVESLSFDSQAILIREIDKTRQWLELHQLPLDLVNKILYMDLVKADGVLHVTNIKMVPFLAFV